MEAWPEASALAEPMTVMRRRDETRRATLLGQSSSNGSWPVKKGRHRRFEEARALKRTNDNLDEMLDARDAEPVRSAVPTPATTTPRGACTTEDADESPWPR